MFRRVLVLTALIAGTVIGLAGSASAGSPHFVSASFTTSGATITVNAKEAGLGAEPQINAVLSGTAECVNGGGQHPKATNKTGFSQAATEPVQNGQSTYSLSATAVFQPPCNPPMSVVFVHVTLTDTTNGISVQLAP
jgi:hypothetical protein